MLVETNHTIIGTAGHIDHGKTALIKALTGVDTDTLAEEKRRGITIELGFAFMDAPGTGKEVLFIDVPGHEKLIKTMVAGASNIDAVLFVVAADDGVSAQTLEHLDILQLLGIGNGVIALTKTDLVDEERIRAVADDVASLVSGTPLESAPVIPVSSVTGVGVSEVKAALVEAVRRAHERRDTGIFRMPIDRVFTMQGFGTVIAGTILSGTVSVGDKLEILPDGLMTRVRGIQVHARSVDTSHIGIRTAVNLMDVKKEQLRRGQSAVAPGTVSASKRLDAQFHLLRSYGESLRNRARLRLHVNADEVMARLMLLDRDAISPGDTAIVQFILETPTVALPKDRFVVREFSTLRTAGGGTVLDAQARAHKRFDESTVQTLEKLGGNVDEIVEQAFVKSGAAPLTAAEAAARTGESEDEVAAAIQRLVDEGRLFRIAPAGSGDADVRQGKFISSQTCDALAGKLLGIIDEYYSRNPYRVFMPASDLQSRFAKLADKQVYEALIANLRERGTLRATRVKVGLVGREPQWKPGERELAARIEKIYEREGYSSPPEDEVREHLNIQPDTFTNVMTALTDTGHLVRIAERVTYHAKHLRAARDYVIGYIRENGGVTAPELRDRMGVTRKFAVAILEYLDNTQVTRRLGDKRVLKSASKDFAA